jgi:hypothetical protein
MVPNAPHLEPGAAPLHHWYDKWYDKHYKQPAGLRCRRCWHGNSGCASPVHHEGGFSTSYAAYHPCQLGVDDVD